MEPDSQDWRRWLGDEKWRIPSHLASLGAAERAVARLDLALSQEPEGSGYLGVLMFSEALRSADLEGRRARAQDLALGLEDAVQIEGRAGRAAVDIHRGLQTVTRPDFRKRVEGHDGESVLADLYRRQALFGIDGSMPPTSTPEQMRSERTYASGEDVAREEDWEVEDKIADLVTEWERMALDIPEGGLVTCARAVEAVIASDLIFAARFSRVLTPYLAQRFTGADTACLFMSDELARAGVRYRAATRDGAREGWLPFFLETAQVSAEKAYERLKALRLLRDRWLEAAGPYTKRSRIPAAVDVVLARPLLSIRTLGAHTGIRSKQGGVLLMKELEDAGIVRETTGRGSFRLYGARELLR